MIFTSQRLDDANGDGVVAIVDVAEKSSCALLDVRPKGFESVLSISANAPTRSSLQGKIIRRKLRSLKIPKYQNVKIPK